MRAEQHGRDGDSEDGFHAANDHADAREAGWRVIPDDVALSLRTCGWCGRESYDLHPSADGGWECAVQVGCAAPSKRRTRVRATALPGGQRTGGAHPSSATAAVHQGAQRRAAR